MDPHVWLPCWVNIPIVKSTLELFSSFSLNWSFGDRARIGRRRPIPNTIQRHRIGHRFSWRWVGRSSGSTRIGRIRDLPKWLWYLTSSLVHRYDLLNPRRCHMTRGRR